ncbi:hypothetical protein [Vagococcus silagei]|uniref:Uncharacterized protein n=1 Tax=Vagococcus silagei TaxID=2508885 RepID=A0A4S3B833_9ENTE|nr:hypothetical protein [Vagococcus silagei]THB62163.1 hypothetical protein ESZ54_01480 [Vagococcus silagei]
MWLIIGLILGTLMILLSLILMVKLRKMGMDEMINRKKVEKYSITLFILGVLLLAITIKFISTTQGYDIPNNPLP